MSSDGKAKTQQDILQDINITQNAMDISMLSTADQNSLKQNGNSFGTPLRVGTNDAEDVIIEQGGVDRIQINSGSINILSGNLTTSGTGATVFIPPPDILRVQNVLANNTINGIVFQGNSTGTPSAVQVTNQNAVISLRPDYETLVTSDGVLTNKKYVDDAITSAVIPPNPNTLLQGGNSFGAQLNVGTNDNNSVVIQRNGIPKVTINDTQSFYDNESLFLGNTTHQGNIVGLGTLQTNGVATCGGFSTLGAISGGTVTAASDLKGERLIGSSVLDGLRLQGDPSLLASEIRVDTNGRLLSNNTTYEALVTTDDTMTNKKYVDDAISSVTGGDLAAIKTAINDMNKLFSFGYTGNTAVTALTANVAAPIVLPNVTPIETQVGTEWTSQTTSGYNEFLFSGTAGLKEATLFFTVENDDGGDIGNLFIQLRVNGIEVSNFQLYVPRNDRGRGVIGGTIFIPVSPSNVYSVWLLNDTNNDDVIVTNFRLTSRNIPNQIP